MGRIARGELLYEGCFAHVFSRSIYKNKIFKEKEDFEKFYSSLIKAKENADLKVFHYCIMQTHFHMAIQLGEVKKFSEALKELKRNYTYWYNGKYKRLGPLWRERFKSMLIEDERYLAACGRYIELNPVKAGLVDACEKWEYSSSGYYILGHMDELVDRYSMYEQVDELEYDAKYFTKGNSVGSKMFKLLLKDAVG